MCASNSNFTFREIQNAIALREDWKIALPLATENRDSHRRFDMLGPIAPQCQSVEKYGNGDEEKRACELSGMIRAMPPGDRCTIISLGSNNQWGFEDAVFEKFPSCQVHVFDCTVHEGSKPPSKIASRTTLHRICIGSEDANISGRPFLSWRSIMGLLNVSRAPVYLKMDIEGYEYEVLRSILRERFLPPLQIAMELHYRWPRRFRWLRRDNISSVGLFMEYMYDRGGYFLIDRHDNERCARCSEILVSRLLCRCDQVYTAGIRPSRAGA